MSNSGTGLSPSSPVHVCWLTRTSLQWSRQEPVELRQHYYYGQSRLPGHPLISTHIPDWSIPHPRIKSHSPRAQTSTTSHVGPDPQVSTHSSSVAKNSTPVGTLVGQPIISEHCPDSSTLYPSSQLQEPRSALSGSQDGSVGKQLFIHKSMPLPSHGLGHSNATYASLQVAMHSLE